MYGALGWGRLSVMARSGKVARVCRVIPMQLTNNKKKKNVYNGRKKFDGDVLNVNFMTDVKIINSTV